MLAEAKNLSASETFDHPAQIAGLVDTYLGYSACYAFLGEKGDSVHYKFVYPPSPQLARETTRKPDFIGKLTPQAAIRAASKLLEEYLHG